MNKRGGLGRGLAALIPTGPTPVDEGSPEVERSTAVEEARPPADKRGVAPTGTLVRDAEP